MKVFAGQVNSSNNAHPSLAECPSHSLKASAVTLASDPVSNISLLSGLQSTLEATEIGRHQLQALATYIARVLSSIIVCHNGTKVRLDRDALHAMVANAHDNQHTSHHESAEQSRVGLAVLLLGVWADRLPARLALAHAKVPEAAEDADCSSGTFTTALSSGAPASASESASESALESASHDEVSPQSPCSAVVEAASQPLPYKADHMSMMASDLEEEEECIQQEWVPDILALLRHCATGHMLRYAMPCHAMLRYAMPCHAVPCHAMLSYAMPCHAMPCHAVPCHAMPCCAMLCFAVLCYAMLFAMLDLFC